MYPTSWQETVEQNRKEAEEKRDEWWYVSGWVNLPNGRRKLLIDGVFSSQMEAENIGRVKWPAGDYKTHSFTTHDKAQHTRAVKAEWFNGTDQEIDAQLASQYARHRENS